MAHFTITKATTTTDIDDTARLMNAYTDSLGLDLSYQSLGEEKSTWPGKYSPSAGGALLIARDTTDNTSVGCVALRKLGEEGYCEMKRLYVDPRTRGWGVGRALAERIIAEAKALGYAAMRLDTLAEMHAARRLYAELGFQEIGAYYETPVERTVFMELWLAGGEAILKGEGEGEVKNDPMRRVRKGE